MVLQELREGRVCKRWNQWVLMVDCPDRKDSELKPRTQISCFFFTLEAGYHSQCISSVWHGNNYMVQSGLWPMVSTSLVLGLPWTLCMARLLVSDLSNRVIWRATQSVRMRHERVNKEAERLGIKLKRVTTMCLQSTHFWSWSNGSAAKINCCSCRVPGLSS